MSPSGAELSRGALVQTAVFARVLGLRLLTLEGTIVLVPTTIGAPDAGRPRSAQSAATRVPHSEQEPRPALGSRLGRVAALLQESDETLRQLDAD